MIDASSVTQKPTFKFVKGDIVRFSLDNTENKITGEIVGLVVSGKNLKQQFYSVKTSDGVTHKIAQSKLVWLLN